MSKQRNRQDARAEEVAKVEAIEAGIKKEVPLHLQCGICFGGRGGTGIPTGWNRLNGALVKRYYKCNMCAHRWHAIVKTHTTILAIQHNEIEVQSHDVDIETR